jgi:hypothetical protein
MKASVILPIIVTPSQKHTVYRTASLLVPARNTKRGSYTAIVIMYIFHLPYKSPRIGKKRQPTAAPAKA